MKILLLIVSLAIIPFVLDEAYAITFGIANATQSSVAFTGGALPPNCTPFATVLGIDDGGVATIAMLRGAEVIPINCSKAALEWDISSIPLNADILSATLTYSMQASIDIPNNFSSQNCEIVQATTQPSSWIGGGASASEAYWNEAGNGTVLVDEWNGCKTTSTNATFVFTPAMLADIRSKIVGGWYGFFVQLEVYEPRNSTNYLPFFNWQQENFTGITIEYELGFFPDAVDDLITDNVEATMLDLEWTQPFVNGTVTGYQINFTTPQGDPVNVIVNDTESEIVNFEVSGLVQSTPYSFRIGLYTNNSLTNMSGNIANVTTFSLGNFTVGFASLNASQADARDFKYTRIDLNSTFSNLEVVYPATFNSSCNFYYKFAKTNNTYFNLATVPIPASSEVRATFQFQNINNEVIDVLCTDETSGVSAPYLMTITTFPLLDQFVNFSSGVYGTEGNFGALDLITLGVIIVMMVGFNRVNESVGAIFAVSLLGFFSFFDIVEWYSFMFGSFAVVIMLTIASTRKM